MLNYEGNVRAGGGLPTKESRRSRLELGRVVGRVSAGEVWLDRETTGGVLAKNLGGDSVDSLLRRNLSQ